MLIVLGTKAGIVFYYVLYFVLGCCIVASLFGCLGLCAWLFWCWDVVCASVSLILMVVGKFWLLVNLTFCGCCDIASPNGFVVWAWIGLGSGLWGLGLWWLGFWLVWCDLWFAVC